MDKVNESLVTEALPTQKVYINCKAGLFSILKRTKFGKNFDSWATGCWVNQLIREGEILIGEPTSGQEEFDQLPIETQNKVTFEALDAVREEEEAIAKAEAEDASVKKKKGKGGK